MPKTNLAQCFKVSMTSAEGKRIVDAFHKTTSRHRCTITKLERIQNVAQWQSYAVKRIQIMHRNGEGDTTAMDESLLEIPIAFHGSDQDTVPKIIQQGFNRSFCGKNAVRYGKGVYFARDSSYSSNDTYSRPDADGVKRMIVCKVRAAVRAWNALSMSLGGEGGGGIWPVGLPLIDVWLAFFRACHHPSRPFCPGAVRHVLPRQERPAHPGRARSHHQPALRRDSQRHGRSHHVDHLPRRPGLPSL